MAYPAKPGGGEIVSVLGQAGNNDVEMHAILAEFGLPYHFPEIVEAEAQIPGKIAKKDIAKLSRHPPPPPPRRTDFTIVCRGCQGLLTTHCR